MSFDWLAAQPHDPPLPHLIDSEPIPADYELVARSGEAPQLGDQMSSNRVGVVAEVVDPDYETLIKEHEDFTLAVGKAGRVSYGAPQGFHDDAVMATALANRARRGLHRAYTLHRPGVGFLEDIAADPDEDEDPLYKTDGSAQFR